MGNREGKTNKRGHKVLWVRFLWEGILIFGRNGDF